MNTRNSDVMQPNGRLCRSIGWILLSLTLNAHADVTGTVRNAEGAPVPGALVSLPEYPDIPRVDSDSRGAFRLASPPSGLQRVTAAMPFDLDDARHYRIAAENVNVRPDGNGQVNLTLRDVPTSDNQTYLPIKAEPPGGCGDCHTEKLTQWRTSMHAGAAVDPWVLDLYDGSGTPLTGTNGYLYTATHDPGSSGNCAVCHAPTANPRDSGSVSLNEITSASALEGVTCTACHQLAATDGEIDALHLLGGARVFFPGVDGSGDTHDYVWGPLPDSNAPFMEIMYAPWISDSRFCASCHEYKNPISGVAGQRTYSEWLASSYAKPGPSYRSCQNCHMPDSETTGTIADATRVGALQRPGAQIHQHGITADATSNLTNALELNVQASTEAGLIRVDVALSNLGLGHAFPTGIGLRNALLVVRARRSGMSLIRNAGPILPWWANDGDPGTQAGDLGGMPGMGFAKVLAGRINGEGDVVRPVLFVDAESVDEDSTLAPGATRSARFDFLLGAASEGDTVDIEVEILYRRAWRSLAVEKGWTDRIDGKHWETQVLRFNTHVELDSAAVAGVFRNGFE